MVAGLDVCSSAGRFSGSLAPGQTLQAAGEINPAGRTQVRPVVRPGIHEAQIREGITGHRSPALVDTAAVLLTKRGVKAGTTSDHRHGQCQPGLKAEVVLMKDGRF